MTCPSGKDYCPHWKLCSMCRSVANAIGSARTTWYNPALTVPYEGEEWRNFDPLNAAVPSPPEQANVVASKLADGRHAPVLDIDYEARLVPSTTEGHYHLYLDQPVTWWRYALVLAAMALAGLIEPGYAKASMRRRMTMVRLPWVSKVMPND